MILDSLIFADRDLLLGFVRGMDELTNDMAKLATDVAKMTTDITTDVAQSMSDIAEVRPDVAVLKTQAADSAISLSATDLGASEIQKLKRLGCLLKSQPQNADNKG